MAEPKKQSPHGRSVSLPLELSEATINQIQSLANAYKSKRRPRASF